MIKDLVFSSNKSKIKKPAIVPFFAEHREKAEHEKRDLNSREIEMYNFEFKGMEKKPVYIMETTIENVVKLKFPI